MGWRWTAWGGVGGMRGWGKVVSGAVWVGLGSAVGGHVCSMPRHQVHVAVPPLLQSPPVATLPATPLLEPAPRHTAPHVVSTTGVRLEETTPVRQPLRRGLCASLAQTASQSTYPAQSPPPAPTMELQKSRPWKSRKLHHRDAGPMAHWLKNRLNPFRKSRKLRMHGTTVVLN